MKKFVYLFLALLVPGLIFVFLKFAGSNRFDIPVYPVEGKSLYSPCAGEISGPYFIPDSAWRVLPDKDKPAHVVMFPVRNLNADETASAVTEEIGSPVVFSLAQSWALDSVLLNRWKTCVFLLQDPWQSVLVDNQGRIRGQYDLRKREETDRLRVEIKILIESY